MTITSIDSDARALHRGSGWCAGIASTAARPDTRKRSNPRNAPTSFWSCRSN